MKFFELISKLEKRGAMFVQPCQYDTIVAYLDGYDRGIVDSGGESEIDIFREWLNQKVGHHCSLHWSAVVRDLFADGNKELALDTLYELLREFHHSQE